MEVTIVTWAIALIGLGLISLLTALQLVAVVRPRAQWTIDNVYGGSPDDTDPQAYFAFNRASAWADPFLWAPLQVVIWVTNAFSGHIASYTDGERSLSWLFGIHVEPVDARQLPAHDRSRDQTHRRRKNTNMNGHEVEPVQGPASNRLQSTREA